MMQRAFPSGEIHEWSVEIHPADWNNYKKIEAPENAWLHLCTYTKGKCQRKFNTEIKTDFKQVEFADHSILYEAQQVIYGDREQTYGSPDKNLQLIADLWSAYLEKTITVDHVCDMMILLKVARLKNQPEHRDSQVDICGYAALKERVQTHRKEKE